MNVKMNDKELLAYYKRNRDSYKEIKNKLINEENDSTQLQRDLDLNGHEADIICGEMDKRGLRKD